MRHLGPLGIYLAVVLSMVGVTSQALQSPSQTDSALSLAAQKYFTDVPLVTQNGDQVRFYTDLLKDKVVVINMFFGACQGICPVSSAMLSSLQNRLGDRLGKDVFLLSFSVDPETDTPAKLKAYGEQFHSKSGWLFLTGKKENVDLALHKLGEKAEHKEDHLTLFMIGNNKTGLWKKVLAPGLTADKLMTIVESVIQDKE
jgi:protein SCO1/2